MTRGYGDPKLAAVSYKSRLARERQERLDRIAAQIAAGELVIRPMTAEERARWGPPARKPARKNLRAITLATPHTHNEEQH